MWCSPLFFPQRATVASFQSGTLDKFFIIHTLHKGEPRQEATYGVVTKKRLLARKECFIYTRSLRTNFSMPSSMLIMMFTENSSNLEWRQLNSQSKESKEKRSPGF